MFLLNKEYHWSIDDICVPDGVILKASALSYGQFIRRINKNPFKKLNLKEIIFDPQLYLLNNDPSYSEINKNINSYPGVHTTPINYDSKLINLSEYKNLLTPTNVSTINSSISDSVKASIDFQLSINVTSIITPSPLIINSNNDLTNYINWTFNSIDYYKKLNISTPLYVSINLSEDFLSNVSFDKNQLFINLLDNLTALDSCIEGYYITLSRSSDCEYITNKNTILAIFELCYVLGIDLGKKIILNSIDTLSLICMAVGASSFASGYFNKAKRTFINDYNSDVGGGGALPRFYSQTLLNNFYPYREFKNIYSLGIISSQSSDNTVLSDSLFKSFDSDSISPEWRESKSNIKTACNHRFLSLKNQANEIFNSHNKIDFVSKLLLNAEIYLTYINQKNNNTFSKYLNHITIWKECFNDFIKFHNL